MDLTIKINDYYLNVRACAIIIHNSKVLVHKSIDKKIIMRYNSRWI